MADIGTIAAALSSIKTAYDIAKAAKGIHDETKLQGAIIELQSAILAAQESALGAQAEQAAMRDQIRNLEARITEFDRWDAEKVKYELQQVYSGAYAYVPKPGAGVPGPVHWLCTACYERRRKSILLSLIHI
jgi:predicted transcriptional regulator